MYELPEQLPNSLKIVLLKMVLLDMYQKLVLYVFSNESFLLFAILEGEMKLPWPPPPYGGLGTENYSFLKGFVKDCFLQKVLQLIHLCVCIW